MKTFWQLIFAFVYVRCICVGNYHKVEMIGLVLLVTIVANCKKIKYFGKINERLAKIFGKVFFKALFSAERDCNWLC